MDTIATGKFLAQLRKERSLTQEQLAEKLGVSNKTVSRWGVHSPQKSALHTSRKNGAESISPPTLSRLRC